MSQSLVSAVQVCQWHFRCYRLCLRQWQILYLPPLQHDLGYEVRELPTAPGNRSVTRVHR